MINVITGNPRSGTSLCTNIFNIIGLSVLGKNRFYNKKDTESQRQYKENLNPDGINEISGITVKGIPNDFKWNTNYNNKTIKIVFSGLINTDPKHIKKGVICLRNPLSIVESQTNLISNVSVVNEKNELTYPQKKFDPLKPFLDLFNFYNYLYVTKTIDKYCVIYYEDWFQDLNKNINILEKHFKLKLSNNLKNKIKDTINKDLYRSKNFDSWPDEFKDIGELFEQIQFNIYNKDFSNIKEINQKCKDILKPINLKRVKWVDDEITAMTIDADVWNRIQNDEKYRELMLDSLVHKRLQNPSLVFVDCPYYSRDTDEEYTIERIPELGSLTRKKVKCGKYKENRTVEDCKKCWLWGFDENTAECYNHKKK